MQRPEAEDAETRGWMFDSVFVMVAFFLAKISHTSQIANHEKSLVMTFSDLPRLEVEFLIINSQGRSYFNYL